MKAFDFGEEDLEEIKKQKHQRISEEEQRPSKDENKKKKKKKKKTHHESSKPSSQLELAQDLVLPRDFKVNKRTSILEPYSTRQQPESLNDRFQS
mmetsp:Transcript_22560/g.19554  ORF Transcript_22560/g.19554 Transcript_22560/m.19554 type:complete len:95 (+) Transcript_22560:5477-5761(+)